jgi:hypothetical protein
MIQSIEVDYENYTVANRRRYIVSDFMTCDGPQKYSIIICVIDVFGYLNRLCFYQIYLFSIALRNE